MPLHPQAQDHLDRLAATAFAQLHEVGVPRARAGMRRLIPSLAQGPQLPVVADIAVPTGFGDLPARLYRPEAVDGLPVTLFLHGGGFVLGDLDTHGGLARSLTAESGAAVVSLDYPLAPEHRYPVAADAVLDAATWLARHGVDLGLDGARLAVAGDSAGGNLAAVTALRARDREAPAIGFQLLIYPDLDFRRSNDSIRELAGRYGNVSRDTQFWFMDSYLDDPSQRTLPTVSPLLCQDLSGLPPTMIVTAEHDALRDEGEQYGARLAAAGVPTVVRRFDGMIHEFVRQNFDDSQVALAEAGRALHTALYAGAGAERFT